ncbi:ModE family transcriptional regulator [Novosphingobium nitrogenifigens DSM 19370]|uniref:ModE family transcriptional regulator n=1 Tax=Novosphingobium nitrogenifigens DSM 19370 TaxID=983920 RepID=F1Z4U4_9SPHN|nr:TOBE domain-containing protein [Novosphingobium nitrogenifigens]EGD60369.1 ModE family transcriptional regulator [Novosphingobium nitrogenifigens DSM 19370]
MSVATSGGAPRARLRTSARNQLYGMVTAIVHGPINAEVGLLVNDRIVIDALVTNTSVEALGLHPGGTAVALIKSSFITLLDDVPGLRLSARNLIGGTIVAIIEGPVESEVVVDIGEETELAAVVTTQSLKDMGLAIGRTTLAAFKASHVILATEA